MLKIKLILILTVMIFFGCSTFQKNSSLDKETTKTKKIKEPVNAKWESSPLFKEGTKPLSNHGSESPSPNLENTTSPCVDSKTGKERGFLLGDLKSELISLAYSNMDRVITSLEVMGMKTLLATAPIAQPYTVDSRGRATYLDPPKEVTTPKTT